MKTLRPLALVAAAVLILGRAAAAHEAHRGRAVVEAPAHPSVAETAAEAPRATTHAHRTPGGPSMGNRIGRFHPLAVHFPIALLWAAAVAEVLAARRPSPARDGAARFLIVAAAVTAIPAAALGLAWAWGETYGGDLAGHFFWHRASGLAAAGLALVAAAARDEAIRRGARGLYGIVLAAAVAAVSVAGYLGAEMTFGPGHLWR